MISMKRLLALLMCVCLVLSFAVLPVLAADDEVPTGNQTEANWVYEVAGGMGMGGGPGGPGGPGGGDGAAMELPAWILEEMMPKATVLWGQGEEKSGNVVMIPATLGGYTVKTVGNGAQNISTNNKNSDVYFLIPEGVTTLSARMIYDYNSTSGWSIPSTVTSISTEPASFLSCAGTFYGEAGSAAEQYAANDSSRDFVTYDADGSAEFTISGGEEGYIQPNGTYHLPSGMLDGKHTVPVHIVADYQNKIASLTVDGTEVAEAAGKNIYEFEYTFTSGSTGIEVAYEADPADSRNPDDMVESFDYEAPEIVDGAVADGAKLPDNVNDYIGIGSGSTPKYTNTMGISTGMYYAADGKVYEMVKSYQTTDEAEYMSLAEAINGVYKADKLVYGKDYDFIRLYNYYENVTSGPSRGVVSLYCVYLYKEIQVSDIKSPNEVSSDHTNTASIFVQKGADLTVDDFTSYCYTAGKGPSEAGNFFGMGSAIHADGGDAATPASNIIYKATSALTLNNPQILGRCNSVYATASAVININGGNIFSCTSGGHGPYVSTGGEILLNTEGTGIITEDNKIVIDTAELTASERPSADLGTMARNADGQMEGVYKDHSDNVTVVVTGDEAGTALATDSGGGVIVANNVVTKTFGLRCAGVYSIGFNESWVYCFNSSLTSYLDAGLCSASGGFIFAYNCDINGVMGMKCRSGGNLDSDQTGIYVNNSRVAASFDAEEMKNSYDVGDPETMQAQLDSGELDLDTLGMSYNKLNMFIDKANRPKFYEDSLDWWFTDKSKTPGYSGGNKFAVIYVENSSTPVYVDSTLLINQNYADYGDPSKLEDGQIPADNLLLSVEGAGSATVCFKNENSQTKWDLTGKSDETTELNGDFYLGAYSQSTGSPDIGTGPNAADIHFENSEWEGTVLYGETNINNFTADCKLTFDQNSSWKVTADTYVASLDIYNVENITADEPVTVYFGETSTVVSGTYGNVTFSGPGVDEWPELVVEEEPEAEASVEEEISAAEELVEEPAAEETTVEKPEAEEAPAEAESSKAPAIAGIVVAVLAVCGIGYGVSRKKKKS